MHLRILFHIILRLQKSLQLTWQHFIKSFKARSNTNPHVYLQKEGDSITLQYPHEQLPVPSRGRYKLHNAIEDCIVCDKCVRVCPVDCIEIEAIPAPDVIGITSNGMKKRIHAAKFDIDMAKCCFCGLCTTVCPTECLTMTPEYDFSVFDILEHKVSFGNMSEAEIIEKKQIWDTYIENKKVLAE
jgi:NADH-quinone oxidoreductase subunit I